MNLKKYLKFENIYSIFSVLILLVYGIVFKSSAAVLVSAVSSMVGNLLNAMSFKVSYLFALIASVTYSFVALEQHYYGEFIYNLFILAPLFIYCTFRWFIPSRKKETSAKGDVFSITPKLALLFGSTLVVVIVVYGYILKVIGSELPFINACSTLFVLGANCLGSRRMKEQWYLFLGSNAFLIILWATAGKTDPGNALYVVQNLLFIVSNSYGLYKWRKISKEEHKA